MLAARARKILLYARASRERSGGIFAIFHLRNWFEWTWGAGGGGQEGVVCRGSGGVMNIYM